MKELTGALINHLYMMDTKLTRLYMLVLTPALVALYITTGDPTASLVLAFSVVLGLATASLENACTPFSTRWSAFVNAWGLAPYMMVISRYIFFILLTAMGLAVWVAMPFELDSGMFTLTHLIIAGQLMCIAYYPIAYLLNPRHESMGIVIQFVAIALAIALTYGMDRLAGDNYFLMAAIVAVLYVVSVALSIAFNAMHRGRVA